MHQSLSYMRHDDWLDNAIRLKNLKRIQYLFHDHRSWCLQDPKLQWCSIRIQCLFAAWSFQSKSCLLKQSCGWTSSLPGSLGLLRDQERHKECETGDWSWSRVSSELSRHSWENQTGVSRQDPGHCSPTTRTWIIQTLGNTSLKYEFYYYKTNTINIDAVL